MLCSQKKLINLQKLIISVFPWSTCLQ